MSELHPNLFVGGRKVLASGTVLSHGSENITMFPFPPPLHLYKIDIYFLVEENHQPWISTAVIDGWFKVTFINSGLQAGSTSSLYCANYLGNKIYIDLAYYTIGSGDLSNRILSYTLCEGGPISG